MSLKFSFPAGNYVFKVNNRNTRTTCEKITRCDYSIQFEKDLCQRKVFLLYRPANLNLFNHLFFLKNIKPKYHISIKINVAQDLICTILFHTYFNWKRNLFENIFSCAWNEEVNSSRSMICCLDKILLTWLTLFLFH